MTIEMIFEDDKFTAEKGRRVYYRVTPATPDKDEEEYRGLPLNDKELDWWCAEQIPCFIGDDMYLAIDPVAKKSYFTFDGWCRTEEWEGTLQEWAEKVTIQYEE